MDTVFAETTENVVVTAIASANGSPSLKKRRWPIGKKKQTKRLSNECIMSRYHRATASKLYDVEELVDYYCHRRLAAIFAVAVSYMPWEITPNQITVVGLLIGWLSVVFVYDGRFQYPFCFGPSTSWFMASFLMFLWIVSDCVDGQVARLCKRGTRTGRVLDGLVDALVIVPHLIVVTKVATDEFGPTYWAFGCAGGLSLWLHAIVYDRIKNVYMSHVLNDCETYGESVDSVRQEWGESWQRSSFSLDTTLLGIYYYYLLLQEKCTNSTKAKASICGENPQVATCLSSTDYSRQYSKLVRAASFTGISAHIVAFYTAYALAYFWIDALVWMLVYFFVVLNGICIPCLIIYGRTNGMKNVLKQ